MDRLFFQFHRPLNSLSLRKLYYEFIKAKAGAKRRAAYIISLRSTLGMFINGRENVSIASISTEDIEGWLQQKNRASSSIACHVGRLSSFFAFAVKRGWIQRNPVTAIERVRIDRQPPVILTPAEARAMMDVVATKVPKASAYFALGLFAGLRPDEIGRIGWSDIDLDRGLVTLNAAAAKTRRRRVVHLMPAGIAWLKYAKARNGTLPMLESNRKNKIRSVRNLLGIRWHPDLLRHTCASYWVGHLRDYGRVAHELGHSEQILHAHYRELVSDSDTAAFWSILPPP